MNFSLGQTKEFGAGQEAGIARFLGAKRLGKILHFPALMIPAGFKHEGTGISHRPQLQVGIGLQQLAKSIRQSRIGRIVAGLTHVDPRQHVLTSCGEKSIWIINGHTP